MLPCPSWCLIPQIHIPIYLLHHHTIINPPLGFLDLHPTQRHVTGSRSVLTVNPHPPTPTTSHALSRDYLLPPPVDKTSPPNPPFYPRDGPIIAQNCKAYKPSGENPHAHGFSPTDSKFTESIRNSLSGPPSWSLLVGAPHAAWDLFALGSRECLSKQKI
ncbi:hypothetical protein BC938DRAFT_478768 [Jimgerdemannia flammicorona]|uniref:Uncharacterized protein n=1 Tax=Jimgerdemannia flammicorona TaxID=994334 RepID=A0A433P4T1_9FUNG|nr:hypothetical protein BC938DRAFT_478768 [Jimgerdemannia flammicorona]